MKISNPQRRALFDARHRVLLRRFPPSWKCFTARPLDQAPDRLLIGPRSHQSRTVESLWSRGLIDIVRLEGGSHRVIPTALGEKALRLECERIAP